MNTKIKITDEAVERAYDAYYTCISEKRTSYRYAMRRALEAAMNPPVVCKNCGKPKSEHNWPSSTHEPGPLCPGYVWEPAS